MGFAQEVLKTGSWRSAADKNQPERASVRLAKGIDLSNSGLSVQSSILTSNSDGDEALMIALWGDRKASSDFDSNAGFWD